MRNMKCPECKARDDEPHSIHCNSMMQLAFGSAEFENDVASLSYSGDYSVNSETIKHLTTTVDGAKNPNPKDSIGSSKIPLHLWPETASIMGSLGLLDGSGKYGRGNYRASPVRASIYYDAAKRHLNGWFSGRPCDPDSGLPDLAHALACIAIIVDAQAAGTLVDDRDYNSGYAKFIDEMTPFVKLLQDKHADKSPKHYTIADNA